MNEDDIEINPDDFQRRELTNIELLAIVVSQNLGKLVLGLLAAVFGYIILSDRGYVPRFEPELWMYLVAAMVPIGYVTARYIYNKTGQAEPEMQYIALITREGIQDRIKIPKGTFAEFSTEGHMPTARTLTGENIWLARAIDFNTKTIIPAGSEPENPDIPNDMDVLAEEGTVRAVHQLEDYLGDLVDLRSEQTISDRVRYKKAKGEITKTIAKRMQEVDNAESLDEAQTEKKAEAVADEVIREMAGLSEGDDNE